MIILKAEFVIKAIGRDTLFAILPEFIQVSRREAGCLYFAVAEDAYEPNRFIVIEHWRDKEVFLRHDQSDHVLEFKAQIGPIVIEKAPTMVYQAESLPSF